MNAESPEKAALRTELKAAAEAAGFDPSHYDFLSCDVDPEAFDRPQVEMRVAFDEACLKRDNWIDLVELEVRDAFRDLLVAVSLRRTRLGLPIHPLSRREGRT